MLVGSNTLLSTRLGSEGNKATALRVFTLYSHTPMVVPTARDSPLEENSISVTLPFPRRAIAPSGNPACVLS